MTVTALGVLNPPPANMSSSGNYYMWQTKRVTLQANQSGIVLCPFNNSWGNTAVFLSQTTGVTIETTGSSPAELLGVDTTDNVIWFLETVTSAKVTFNHPLVAVRITNNGTGVLTADIIP